MFNKKDLKFWVIIGFLIGLTGFTYYSLLVGFYMKMWQSILFTLLWFYVYSELYPTIKAKLDELEKRE